jgi:hypothetical protein
MDKKYLGMNLNSKLQSLNLSKAILIDRLSVKKKTVSNEDLIQLGSIELKIVKLKKKIVSKIKNHLDEN